MRRRISVIGLIWALLHAYIGVRLLPPLHLPPAALAAATVLLLCVAAAPFAAFLVWREDERPLGRAAHWIGYTTLGFSSILLVLVLATDLAFVRMWGIRSEVLSPLLLGGAALLTAVGIWGARRPRVVRVAVPISGLPADLESEFRSDHATNVGGNAD